jgi:hypothetical protein
MHIRVWSQTFAVLVSARTLVSVHCHVHGVQISKNKGAAALDGPNINTPQLLITGALLITNTHHLAHDSTKHSVQPTSITFLQRPLPLLADFTERNAEFQASSFQVT